MIDIQELKRLAEAATPMVHQCCGREQCDGTDCPNKGPWYKVPKWRMDGYYYSFDPTGNAVIDKILSAVACAGKAYHNTEDWNDECSACEPLRGNTVVEAIQNAAIDASATILSLIQRVEELEKALQPFANFYPSLLEWRWPGGIRMRDEWPEHKPVLSRSYPLDELMAQVCDLYVGDFKAANIAAQSTKEQG